MAEPSLRRRPARLDDAAPPEETRDEPAAPALGPLTLSEEAPGSVVPSQLDLVVAEHPGRYLLRGLHGRGGQGQVLLAYDRHTGRDVALKVSESMGATTRVARFVREARVTAQLEHPNIVPVYELGRRDDGALYYTMRLVRGKTLSRRLSEARNLGERLRLLPAFSDICNAVAYAHSRGVIHRDIKPSNAMVGEFGETVLLDWGLAKVLGAAEPSRELNLFEDDEGGTAAGRAIGTPGYMSPEQASGKLGCIDERSDVWSLGAVLYRILTGNPPHAGARALADAAVGRLVPVLTACPEAPPELAAVCEKAMQPEPEARYRSAKELAREVETYLVGGRVAAYRYRSWDLFRRFASQHKAAFSAAGLVMVSVIGALIAVSLALRSESRALAQESEARAMEQKERLNASFRLAQAYSERADRSLAERRYGAAALFASRALLNDPSYPASPAFSPGFAEEHPESGPLRVGALSAVFASRMHRGVTHRRTVLAPEALLTLSISPAGDFAAAVGQDGVTRLWEASSGRQIWELGASGGPDHGLALAPDGRLAAVGDGAAVLLLDAATGARRMTLQGHAGQVTALGWSGDGAVLASGGLDRSVRLWDARTGEARSTIALDEAVSALALSPDGRVLAVGGAGRKARVFFVTSGLSLGERLASGNVVRTLAFSPDGGLLAVAGSGERVPVYRALSGELAFELGAHPGAALGVAFSPDGARLASAAGDGSLRLWDARDGRLLQVIDAHGGMASGVSFAASGGALASIGYDRALRFWSLSGAGEHPGFKAHDEPLYGLAFLGGTGRLATASLDKTARVFEAGSGRLLTSLEGHSAPIVRLASSPDARRVATAAADRTVRIWDVAGAADPIVLRLPGGVANGVAFSPDGARVATAGADGKVILWDLAAAAPILTLEGAPQGEANVAFSPDGALLAACGLDKAVRVWSLPSGKALASLGGHLDWVWDVGFSPEGARLITASKDSTGGVWDPASGRRHFALVGHGQFVNAVRMSPDGKLLATGSDDRTVRVWSAADGAPLLSLGAAREVAALDFSPDGKLLAVGDGGEVAIYPMDLSVLSAPAQDLAAEAERASGMRLDGFRVVPAP